MRISRVHSAVVAAAVGLIAGVPWGVTAIAQARGPHHHGRSHYAGARHRHHRRHRRGVRADSPPQVGPPPAFDVHLTPTFDVGQAGWNIVIENHGGYGGGTGIGVIHPSTPFVSVSGSGGGGTHLWTTVAVTLPQVSAVRVEGSDTPVATEALPGLPFGLRVVRIVQPFEEPEGSSLLAHRPQIKPMVALGANGEEIPQGTSRETRETPFQGAVHRWSAPESPTEGSCELHAGGASGLTAENGATLTDIRPYPGQIFASAFLPCAFTLYSLNGHELRAYVLLDAAQPGTPPALIPGLAPVPGAPGVYGGNSGYYGGPTNLTAERSANAWLAVQGGESSERMQLLEDLSATVKL